jgi:NAD(P)-dependent dehydrogenase (short-subunit alcohol dehydrogenase family)
MMPLKVVDSHKYYLDGLAAFMDDPDRLGQDPRQDLRCATNEAIGRAHGTGGSRDLLASDQASYVTGQTIVIDGRLTLT